MFFRVAVLKKVAIYRKAPVLKSLFKKVAALKVCNFIKKRLQHSCCPVNVAKFLRTAFYKTPLMAAPVRGCHEK